MRMLASLLLIAVQPIATTAARAAAPAPVASPDITVTGDDRLVCRRITRTATRMRTGRICRPLSQWTAEVTDRGANSANASIEGASDSLVQISEKISTGCGEGGGGHNGPLGPR
jgi:hypothetical protein